MNSPSVKTVPILTIGARNMLACLVSAFACLPCQGQTAVAPPAVAESASSAANESRAGYEGTNRVYQPVGSPRPVPMSMPVNRVRLERQARETVDRLVAASDQAFARGLLPLQDHLRQLHLADELEFASTGDALELARRRYARYEQAARRLQALAQPNAEGYRADTAYAGFVAARAQRELGILTGNRSVIDAATDTMRRTADQFLLHAAFDAGVGIGQPETVIAAERLAEMVQSPGWSDLTAGREGSLQSRQVERLEQLQQYVDRWNSVGAGIGNQPRGLQLQLAIQELQLQALAGNPDANSPQILAARHQQLSAALATSDQLMMVERERLADGTGSLFRIADAWMSREQLLHRFSPEREPAGAFPAGSSNTNTTTERDDAVHQAGLEQLQRLSNNTRDRRGRISADLQFVAGLDSLHRLRHEPMTPRDPFAAVPR